MRAFAVGAKLAIEAADGGGEFHDMSMNASKGKEVNSILRSVWTVLFWGMGRRIYGEWRPVLAGVATFWEVGG